MDKTLVFGIKEGDGVIYLTVAKKRINVPPFGVLTAAEVMKREDVLRHLVASRKVFPVLRELTAEEVAAYEQVEKTPEQLAQEAADAQAAKEQKDADDAKAAEQAKIALEAAQAEYETLTGKKPGTMKLGTLQKKIEEAKSKTD